MARLLFGPTGFLGQSYLGESPQTMDLIPVGRAIADLNKDFESALSAFIKTQNRPVNAAYLTLAMSNPDDCRRQPELSRRINVDGMIRLFDVLKEFQIKPVFISSDHVFDGQKGFFTESEPYAPVTLYGEQKVEAEKYLTRHLPDALILRTSKQVSQTPHKKNILAEMALKLRAGQPVRCATDQMLSPVFTEDIVAVSHAAVDVGLTGIWHVSPSIEYSRYEYGRQFAVSIGADPGLVQPCLMKEFNFPEPRPPRCTLDGRRLQERLGFRYRTLEEGARTLLRQMT